MNSLRPILFLIIAAGVAFGLSSDRFLSTREYTPYSTRGSAPIVHTEKVKQTDATGGNPYDYATMWSFSPGEMKTFLVPTYYGFGKMDFDSQKHTGYQYLSDGKISSYWGQKPIEDAPPYMGLIILILGIAGIVMNYRSPFTWFLALLSLFSVLISFGYTFPLVYDIFYYHFPSFNKFRAPSMSLVLIQFALPVLAAMAFDKFLKKQDSDEENKSLDLGLKVVYGIAGLCVLFSLATLFDKSGYYSQIAGSRLAQSIPEQVRTAVVGEFQRFVWGELTTDLYLAIFYSLAVAGVLFAAFRGFLSKSLASGVIIILTIFDLWAVGKRPMEVSQTKLTETEFAQKDYYDFIKQDKELFRIADFSSSSPNMTAYYGLQNVNGYHSAKLRIYQDLLDATCDGSTSNVTNPFLWSLMNVKYLVTTKPMAPGMVPAYQSQSGVLVYKLDNYLPRAFFVKTVAEAKPMEILEKLKYDPANLKFNPTDVAFIEKPLTQKIDSNITGSQAVNTKFENELIEFDVTAAGNNFLEVSEIYYPAGWKAYLDGKEIEIIKTNFAFRGVVIPQGNHKLKFEFKDEAFEKGRTISTATSIILGLSLLASLVMEFRRRKKKEDTASE